MTNTVQPLPLVYYTDTAALRFTLKPAKLDNER